MKTKSPVTADQRPQTGYVCAVEHSLGNEVVLTSLESTNALPRKGQCSHEFSENKFGTAGSGLAHLRRLPGSSTRPFPRDWRGNVSLRRISPSQAPVLNLEGYVRSPARGFVRHGRRPHISRIERRRGAVSYGESAAAVLILNAKACVARAAAGRSQTGLNARRRAFGRSGEDGDDAVDTEASGRRASDALNLAPAAQRRGGVRVRRRSRSGRCSWS